MGQFNKWIKEFVALVFIQSVQAFSFAIIIVMIVKLLGDSDSTNSDVAMASGFLSVIALFTISKIEDLVKKMVGFGPSVTDTSLRGGLQSVATGFLAFSAGRRLLDNGKKIGGGITNRVKAANREKQVLQSKKKAQDKYLKYFEEQNKKEQQKTQQERQRKQEAEQEFANFSGASNANFNGNRGTGGKGGTGQPIYININMADVAGGGTVNKNGVNVSANSPSNAKSPAGISFKDMRDYDNMIEKYDDKLDQIKKDKKDSNIMIKKGLSESFASFGGAAVGLVGGLAASGDVSSSIKSAVTGAGIGDYIGEQVVEIPVNIKTVINKGRDIGGKKQLQKEIKDRQEKIEHLYRFKDHNIDDIES